MVIEMNDHGAIEEQDRWAGDSPANVVVSAVLSRVRCYDLVIASGDKLVVAVCGAAIVAARERFVDIQRSLAQAGVTFSVGCAQPGAGDTMTTLIDRADTDRLVTTAAIPRHTSTQATAPAC